MEKTDPLAQLKDIHLPDPVGLWPLAWGWWVLLALILLSIALAVYFWRRNKARNRYRALALAELARAKQTFEQHQNTADYLQHLSITLRRAAMSAFSSRYHANLKGEAWLRWLDQQCPACNQGFSDGAGRALLTGPYEAKPQADVTELHTLAARWLRQHRNQWQRSKAQTSAKSPQTQTPAEATTDA